MQSSTVLLNMGTPEKRQELKIMAAKAGKSMNQYVYDLIFNPSQNEDSRRTTAS